MIMLLMSKNKDSIVNLEYVENIYIGANGTSIKMISNSGSGSQLGAYTTSEETKMALNILSNRIKSNESLIEMPTEKDIQAEVVSLGVEKQTCSTGKKTKRRGGS